MTTIIKNIKTVKHTNNIILYNKTLPLKYYNGNLQTANDIACNNLMSSYQACHIK